MKRAIALLIVICLLLCGCANGDTPSDKDKTTRPDTSSVDKQENENNSSSEDTSSSDDVSDSPSTPSNMQSSTNTSSGNTSSDSNTNENPTNTDTSGEIRPGKDSYTLSNPQKAGADAEANILREAIRNSKDALSNKGTVYYIAVDGDIDNDGKTPETPWNLDSYTINNFILKPGDAVLFKRGDIFRIKSGIAAVSGVNYGAYGTGDKPAFYASMRNYAEDQIWYPADRKYIWKTDFPLSEAGSIVFNHGESYGNRVLSLRKMEKNGDFYHDTLGGTVYLYCDKGYPDIVYKDIEIAYETTVISGTRSSDIHIDNLCFRYVGGHSINFTNSKNITITNCEFGWGGGAYLLDSGERYGNAIQFWESAEDILVENCWMYQQYDTGLTFQSNSEAVYRDITFRNNLVEYCVYSFEFFISDSKAGDRSEYTNISIDNNIFRLAGYGWGANRPYPIAVSHICGWVHLLDTEKHAPKENTTNFVIKNNIFDCSTNNLVYWGWEENESQPGLIITNNTYYQKKIDRFYHKLIPTTPTPAIRFAYHSLKATNQTELEQAVSVFDTSPKKVKWIG